MAAPVSADRIVLNSKRRRQLERIVSRPTSPQRLVRRARIVLLASEGWPNTKIAAELGCGAATVSTCRGRYAARGIDGLFDAPRSGRPEVHGPSVRLAVVAIATTIPPEGTSVWSHQMIADHLARRGLVISPASAGRILAEAEVRPHKLRSWLKRADDPAFWAQAGAVCAPYLNPPPGTVLISVDEKTGIQAKSRRHPDTTARRGRDTRRDFEYVRHGTVSIIAAMNVTTGEVIAQRIQRMTITKRHPRPQGTSAGLH
jgi:transposase